MTAYGTAGSRYLISHGLITIRVVVEFTGLSSRLLHLKSFSEGSLRDSIEFRDWGYPGLSLRAVASYLFFSLPYC